MLNSQFCASTVFSFPLFWGMTMEESSGLNQDWKNVSDFIHFSLKKYIHMFVYSHRNIEVCVWMKKRRRFCMFIGLAVPVIMRVPSVSLQYWRLMCLCFHLAIFWCHLTCDISKTWTWMWSRRLPAHTAAAEQLQRLALKAAASLLPYDYHDMCHQDNESWTELISDTYWTKPGSVWSVMPTLRGYTPECVCCVL